jgi:hypothetical protein
MATAAAALAPVGNEWSGTGKVQRQVWPGDQGAAAAIASGANHPWLGPLVLIAVAVAAVGAFTALQLRAWSRRRSPSGRSRDIYDWRTLPPPPQEDDPGPGETPPGQQESYQHENYGPLWRYGAPRGYRRDYEPGCEPARGPGYARDSDAGPGPGDNPGPGYGSGPGYDPGFAPGARRPWRIPGDVPRDRRP